MGSVAVTVATLDSPVGPLTAGVTDAGLALLEFSDPARLDPQLATLHRLFGPTDGGGHPMLDQVTTELAEYFAGTRRRFEVPLVIKGTPFQEAVWRALLAIPYGTTCAYSDVAARLGKANGQRAVGLANGQNRIAIVIPCHRVIERAGGLRGYGGGLPRKKFLLDLEGRGSNPLAGTPLGAELER